MTILKYLFIKLKSPELIKWFLDFITDLTPMKFDNELVDLGEAIVEGNHKKAMAELEQLKIAVQADWDKYINK